MSGGRTDFQAQLRLLAGAGAQYGRGGNGGADKEVRIQGYPGVYQNMHICPHMVKNKGDSPLY